MGDEINVARGQVIVGAEEGVEGGTFDRAHDEGPQHVPANVVPLVTWLQDAPFSHISPGCALSGFSVTGHV